MQNIGIAFVKLGQYNEAITSFEHVLAEEPNFITGFNLILCYFAMGDRSVVIGDNCVVIGGDLDVCRKQVRTRNDVGCEATSRSSYQSRVRARFIIRQKSVCV